MKGIFELEKGHLKPRDEVFASASITLSATSLEQASSGMPLVVANTGLERVKSEVQKEIRRVMIDTDKEGVVIKADTLGSLEALIKLLKDIDAPIKKAGIGNITKRDISSAASDNNELYRVVLGFNVDAEPGSGTLVINEKVIYKIVEKYDAWRKKKEKEREEREVRELPRPFKFQILKGYVFRASNPAVVGVEVLMGTMKPGRSLIKRDNSKTGELKTIQKDKKVVESARKDEEVAVSIPGVMVGRQISEGDVLYSNVSESEFRRMKELKKYLSQDEKDLLVEIAGIKRKEKSEWGF